MTVTATNVQPRIRNGVDLDRLHGTIKAVRNEPALGAFVFRARNTWLGGGHNRSFVKGFYGAAQEDTTRTKTFVIDNDEPDVLLGTDLGPNPVEHVLHALAGCLTTSLVYHAAARGIRIDEVESTYEGDLDLRGFLGITDEVRNGYQAIRVTFKVKGDATPEQIEELVQVAQQRSPVFDTLSRPVPIEVRAAK